MWNNPGLGFLKGQAVMMECITDPRMFVSIRRNLEIILTPESYIFKV